ncbi:glycosyltransferase [Methanobacterium sp. ACI-7]|uniref:glycosyltransferase n=1 Tax=unclassified Methanobacterium TaxID=2627676 RepID=UPI0039C4D209
MVNIGLILAFGFKIVMIYSIIIGIFSILQIFISNYFYKTPEIDEHYFPFATVVVPAYNEAKTIEKTLKSCVNNGYPLDKLEIITVNDGSNDYGSDGKSRTLSLMYKIQDNILNKKGFKIKVLNLGENCGKREAMIRGFLKASDKSKIFVTVDADSYIKKGAIHKLVQPFKNKKVGAVSGNTEIANLDKTLTKMQNYMYWISFNIFKASESSLGTVLCCPGCFSAFRKKDVFEVLPQFRNETFCNVSEDRNLTNLVLEKDKDIVYHNEALTKTNVPEKMIQFVKQQYRWKISTIYENLFIVSRFIHRKNPLIIFNFYVSFILIFSWSIAAIYALFFQITGGATSWTVLFWLTCMPIFPIYWAMKEKKIHNFGYGFLSLYLWMFIIDLLNYLAFANLRTDKWAGKEKSNLNTSKRITNQLSTAPRIFLETSKDIISKIPCPQSKRASLIQSIIITVFILVLMASAYYINLRLPVTQLIAYILTSIFYLSQLTYIALLQFISNYWIGLIGMIVFGVGGSKIIKKIGYNNEKGRPLRNITNEIYPELNDKEQDKLIKDSIPTLNNIILKQNDTIASPLFILSNLPVIGKIISSLLKNRIGTILIKPITWVIEILTMLILYRFFLRHFLLPMSLSSKDITAIVGEENVKQMMIGIKETSEETKKRRNRLKNFFTIESFLNYFDFKILKWSQKKENRNILWNIPLAFAILVRSFSSLIRQRLVISFIAMYIATPIAFLLFSEELLNTSIVDLPVPLTGIFPVTLALVITSFFVMFFLELPRMKSLWVEYRKKWNLKKTLPNWILKSSAFLLAGTLSMILIGPELLFALKLTVGIPILGETVRFMEEFVYGANGQGGIGEKILKVIEVNSGLVNPNPVKDGWLMPQSWKIEKNGQGVMPEPMDSLKVDGPGEASSHLISVDRTRNYVIQYMADTKIKDTSIDVSIEEFSMSDSEAILLNRVDCGSVDGEQGIEYITANYKPSSPKVSSVRVVIEGVDNGHGVNGYVDGIKLSRVTDSAATKELKKPHIILRFDDGWANQADDEMKTDDYGYPAVYNIISNVMPDELTDSSKKRNYMSLQKVFQLSKENQIGTHSGGYQNDNIAEASNEDILFETLYQYQILKILGFDSDTYASPNFLYNPTSLRAIYRTFNSHQIEENYNIDAYKFPFNRYNFYTVEPVQLEKELKSNNTLVNDPSLMNIEETKHFIDTAALNNATPVLMFHVINNAGDLPENKLEMETTAYNEILDYIHSKQIPVVTFKQLLDLQEESLSDLPINSFDSKGIKGEEGTYYPIGTVKVIGENGIVLDDYLSNEDIKPLNIPSLNYIFDDIIQEYAQTSINSHFQDISLIPLAAGAGILAISNKFIIKENSKSNEEYGEYLICKQCDNYYKLKKDESPEDFSGCSCGGDLYYKKVK